MPLSVSAVPFPKDAVRDAVPRSNTEPIIRLVAEAEDGKRARRLIDDVRIRVGTCLDV